ncbi:hypothetical protein [Rhizobium leguminosarum]|uniref:hypothetical protein n=1 Tax=Rhizobium leguminosarum TaxID=384 RepID=UPI00161763E4|nr:hypothetical protein [Rhizobium leguminosarum]MBB4345122.1 hypothetical protein [Rhizobium leguminosarum]MBB6298193.1 hypothetical protein [Rhizobium leguminosarum]
MPIQVDPPESGNKAIGWGVLGGAVFLAVVFMTMPLAVPLALVAIGAFGVWWLRR